MPRCELRLMVAVGLPPLQTTKKIASVIAKTLSNDDGSEAVLALSAGRCISYYIRKT